MRYQVVFNWGTAYAVDHGTLVRFDHGIEPIMRRGWETATQAIRRVYPNVEIFPVTDPNFQRPATPGQGETKKGE